MVFHLHGNSRDDNHRSAQPCDSIIVVVVVVAVASCNCYTRLYLLLLCRSDCCSRLKLIIDEHGTSFAPTHSPNVGCT